MKKNQYLEGVYKFLKCFGGFCFVCAGVWLVITLYSEAFSFPDIISVIISLITSGTLFIVIAKVLRELLNMIYDLQESLSSSDMTRVLKSNNQIQEEIDQELEQYSDSIFFK